ncbi:MAG TPA: hypothetical protein VHL57_09535 [Flavobacteriales bacterium]|nr:hypothetical protein [Flavobacteriales bacterium]
MARYLLSCSLLLACLLPVRLSAQAVFGDTTRVTVGVGVGLAYEPLDLDAMNARLRLVGLAEAPDIPVQLRLDFLVATRRILVTISETVGFNKDRTDSSTVRSSAVNLQFGVGYALKHDARWLVAPMVGYRFSAFTYEHYMDLHDQTFAGSLQSSTHEVRDSYSRHNLFLGAYCSYGGQVAVAFQGGYQLPIGDGSWRTGGTFEKLSDGPSIDQNVFLGVTLTFRRALRTRLP